MTREDAVTEIELYVQVKPLPTWRPAHVVRDPEDGAVLLTIDPWADRVDLLGTMLSMLTDAELVAYLEPLGLDSAPALVAWLRETGPMRVPEHLWLGPDTDGLSQ